LKKFQFEYVEGSVFERSEANENRKARRCHKKLLLLNLKGRLRRNVKLIPEPGKFRWNCRGISNATAVIPCFVKYVGADIKDASRNFCEKFYFRLVSMKYSIVR
jgi:hypothetical protein